MTVFSASVAETLTFADSSAKQVTHVRADSFGVSDQYLRSAVTVGRADAFTAADSASRFGTGIRAAAEAAGFSDALAGITATVSRLESIKFTELLVGAAEAVISYLTVLSKGSREDEMLKLFDHGPLGFSRFRRFYPGVLNFQSMIVKTVLRTRDKNTVPRIQALKTTIDVADKRLQGSATLTYTDSSTTGLLVTFSQVFFTPPEVVVLWKGGGSPGRAELVPGSTDETGFRVKLFDVVTNLPIAGDITYAALGY